MNDTDDADARGRLHAASERFLDGLFGEGRGRRHTRYLEFIANESLRDQLHRYHAMEGDATHLSVEENYLLGMCVLCATRSFGPAAMFAKTLMHLGTKRERILAAVARLSMWTGGIPAAEATGYIERAIREYEKLGIASLDAWFPPDPAAAGGAPNDG